MSMADMPGSIWFNGQLVPWHEARIHVLTHSLHYGTGVFEGVRSYKTTKGPAIFRLKEHTQRLFNSMKILNMPCKFDFDTIFDAQKTIIKENKLESAYIRPICFFNDDSLGVPVTKVGTSTAIAAWKWGAYLGENALENGVSVHVSSFTRHHVNATMCKAKVTGHYVNSMLAVQQAIAAGYKEAILLDPHGYVAEGTGENIFLIKNGELLTPELTSCLEGITRSTVISIAQENNYKITERSITRDELYTADEIFFTGTAAEVTPVIAVDGRQVGSGKPGVVTKSIQQQYFDIVEGKNSKYQEWLTIVA